MWKTTYWPQILQAQKHDKEALNKLCQDYWQPVHRFVAKYCGVDAEDLTQEFFAAFLSKNWLARVSEEKGKFRTFLLVTLIRFIRDYRQKKQNVFENSFLKSEIVEQQATKDFDLFWTEKLLALVATRMHSECRNNSSYLIFRMYFSYEKNLFFCPEDIIVVNHFFNKISQQNSNLDTIIFSHFKENIIWNTISLDEKYHLTSRILNEIIANSVLEPFSNNKDIYKIGLLDCKICDWVLWQREMELKIPSSKKISPTQQSIFSFLNDVILKRNFEESFLSKEKEMLPLPHKNRLLLETMFPHLFESYHARRNRQILQQAYKKFVSSVFQESTSYVSIAAYFSISKHQVEKSIKECTRTYKKIMRDEVARYVCPKEILDEISYLQNIV